METNRVDILNIFLIIISLFLAITMPFKVFLWAYAFIGPLHYLTEINWLHGKRYFASLNNVWLLIPVIACLILVIPKLVFTYSELKPTDDSMLSSIIYQTARYSTGLIFLCLSLSIAVLFTRKKEYIWIVGLISAVLAYVLNDLPFYSIGFGLLLPTLVHVYLFTILFMLYGATSSNSKFGYTGVAMMILIPLVIVYIDVDPSNYLISQYVKDTYLQNNFHITNIRLSQLFGMSDGTSFYFYENTEIKVQIFIAFAYIYHYLNWFSKTTVIKWHEQLSVRNTIIIVIIWIAMSLLFWHDYQLGFYIALFFSFLHVILEFPLNIRSIKSVLNSAS